MSEALCAQCASPYQQRRSDQRFCSRRCNQAHFRDSYSKTCTAGDCSKAVRAKGLCSMHWKRKYGKQQKFPITCLTCGSEHLSARRDGKYCSEACKGIGLRKRYSTALVLWTPPPKQPRTASGSLRPMRRCWYAGQCARCSASFVSDQPRSRYCSRSCLRSDGKDKRRALKREAFVAEVRRTRIFERDGWTCQLCRRKVKRAAIVPDPLAPVLDHIVPLAKGGTHEPANVQCAHFMCNSLKGDRGGGEQLMLIG